MEKQMQVEDIKRIVQASDTTPLVGPKSPSDYRRTRFTRLASKVMLGVVYFFICFFVARFCEHFLGPLGETAWIGTIALMVASARLAF